MMKSKILILAIFPFFMGCAAFKHLEPDPAITPAEGKFIELKDDGESFELDKGKKYFIAFPAPIQENFYLLINVNDKDAIIAGMADKFDADKGLLSRVANEAAPDINEYVYTVKPSVQKFYWAIENVYRDFVLNMSYRYLPKWRYKFETQHDTFQKILQENKVDRATYNSIGSGVSFKNFNFSSAITELESKSSNLEKLFQQLAVIESLFPSSILNSNDEAYQNYLILKENISEERKFQDSYKITLKAFELELKTRDDMPLFARSLPDFLQFYKNKSNFPPNVIAEANRIFEARLDELTPFYNEHVRSKNNFKPIDLNIENVNNLYKETGANKNNAYKELSAFIKNYNYKANNLIEVRAAIDELNSKVSAKDDWPNSNYFKNISAELNDIAKDAPKAGFNNYPKYKSLNCSKYLNNALYSLDNDIRALKANYKKADGIVSQLNRYAGDKSYQQMIQVINKNKDLRYLKKMYADLDNKSLNRQKALIDLSLKQQNWRRAEDGLRGLHGDVHFINLKSVKPKKWAAVKALEDTLLNRVERVTKEKVDAFVSNRYSEVENVEGLYQNKVFQAAWDITFSSGSKKELAVRKAKLDNRLKSLKEIVFPKKAIEYLYKDFVKNINNNGVAKARAIVIHGQYYKGDDRSIKNLVAECDPWASKWMTKEVQYRKLYVLPTTTNLNGENTYVFRVNLRISTDARFPAYDVNIKLPEAIANSSNAWYEQMTMNKKILKPEGRFTITTPNKANDFTALITPLQVVKDGDSILEVRFKHNSYKVFEVSIMAQKPILRKN